MPLFSVPVEETIVRRSICFVSAKDVREAAFMAKNGDYLTNLVVEGDISTSRLSVEKNAREITGVKMYEKSKTLRPRDIEALMHANIVRDLQSSEQDIEDRAQGKPQGDIKDDISGYQVAPSSPYAARNPLAPVKVGNLKMVPERYEATWKGETVALSIGEFKVVYLIACDPLVVRTRNDILTVTSGRPDLLDERTADSFMKRVRRAFRNVDPEFTAIETVYGGGYRWRPDGEVEHFKVSDANEFGGGSRYERHDEMTFDLQGLDAYLLGKPLKLTVTMFKILLAMARAKGGLVTRVFLIEHIAAGVDFKSDRLIDSQVKRIRRLIEKIDPTYNPIGIEYGEGYFWRCR